MTRLSSNWTLFHKFFIPTFWIVFLGACVTTTWIMEVTIIPGLPPSIFRILLTIIYVAGLLVMYLFTIRLKRVEIDQEYIYVTNYFKHYRYPHIDIDHIAESKIPLFATSTIHLKSAGTLGKEIKYLAVKGWLQDFLKAHPAADIDVR